MYPDRSARFGAPDIVLLLLAGAALAALAWRLRAFSGYDWDFGLIGDYLVRVDPETGAFAPGLLLRGLFATIRLAFWATLVAVVVGTAAGLARTAPRLFPRLVSRSYVELMRNTPPLVLIFLFYFFVGDRILAALGAEDFARSLTGMPRELLTTLLAPPERFTQMVSGVITLGLYEGAYIAEIVRAGIGSVERGQWEGAFALGLSRWQRMRHVILPQALRKVVPPLAGQFISTIKDSSIVAVVSIPELTFQGLELMASTYRTFEIWLTVLALYLGLCLACSLAARSLETSLARRWR